MEDKLNISTPINEKQIYRHILEDGEFIKNIITLDMINQWRPGDKILINANTGAGKTHFILHTLYQWLKEKTQDLPPRKRILLLTNRSVLRDQLLSLYGQETDDLVEIMNYQALLQILADSSAGVYQYDVIVADECHYFLRDAAFADSTDVVLNYLTDKTDQSIVLFMSATSFGLEQYFEKYCPSKLSYCYYITRPYVFGECFYWRNQDAIQKLLFSLPKDEKVIYFGSSIDQMLELHKLFPQNSTFVCSKENKKYGKLSDQETREQIEKNEKFEKQILFATTSLENGINICDPSLKHIIIDLYDFDAIIQSVGRRRVTAGETPPNLYVRRIRQPSIKTRGEAAKRMLEPVDYFYNNGVDQFCSAYGRKNLNAMLYTVGVKNGLCLYEVNKAKEFRYRRDIEIGEAINALSTEFGHLQMLCKLMKIFSKDFESLEKRCTAMSLEATLLDQYLEVRLYKNKKSEFLSILKKEVLCPLKGGYQVKTINSYFADIGMPYRVDQGRDRTQNSPFFNQRYWILRKKAVPEK